MRRRVDYRHNVHITAAVRLDCPKYVNTADIYAETIIFHLNVSSLILKLTLDTVRVDNLCVLGIIFKHFFQNSRISFIIYDGVHLAVVERLRLLCEACIFSGGNGFSKLLIDGVHGLPDLVAVHTVLNAEHVVRSACNILGRIVGHDSHNDIVQLIIAASNI